ncbi:fumarylacetoacetate hydrolase family protein [Spelaeicoccus albus]|uniref:2-keto-4-pentenoate hydratase/2-oxohepta-3-ene-1,7-dioic acid hydratase in catechol pathway n=1 Tax=Spelaeicoccus albus TaxID=1280376 RepID=A0A7Z0AB82_9MICO|nr:fumarylacetoacetate hydrolase family protein [Spelaeicoccus albus]NYI66665.1 2-keto-4-pentenoate hydratase/2-oxohepta-3-ene-1,7-dioic acid hydratase in catechol pathway [Spelaeicoccus albus]
MKFARIGARGAERPIAIDGDIHYALDSITDDLDGEFWSSGGPARVEKALAAGELPEVDIAGQRIGAPITRPSAVICIGMNYAAHAAESGSEPPKMPIMFLKTPNTVVGPNDAVAIPRGSSKTDWEVELGVVIGAHAEYLDSPADSKAHIAGFAVTNDLSEREFQLEISGGQWSKGKSCPGFCPTGPWLVTPDAIDYSNVRLRSWVNGNPRQDSTTSDLVFDVDYLVWYLSQFLALEPGDLICTGTPEGVALSGKFPYLTAGDTVTLEIDGLGRQTQEFTSSEAKA